mgnify:CR=1 FL=1
MAISMSKPKAAARKEIIPINKPNSPNLQAHNRLPETNLLPIISNKIRTEIGINVKIIFISTISSDSQSIVYMLLNHILSQYPLRL